MREKELEFTPLETKVQFKNRRMFLTGFTLVEVIVALVIMLITATGVFSSFIVVKRYVVRATHRILALNFARQELEEFRPQASSLTPTTWTSYENLPGEFYSKFNAQRCYKVEIVTDRDYHKVTVKIRWDEP